jgi:hypothetical protein
VNAPGGCALASALGPLANPALDPLIANAPQGACVEDVVSPVDRTPGHGHTTGNAPPRLCSTRDGERYPLVGSAGEHEAGADHCGGTVPLNHRRACPDLHPQAGPARCQGDGRETDGLAHEVVLTLVHRTFIEGRQHVIGHPERGCEQSHRELDHAPPPQTQTRLS